MTTPRTQAARRMRMAELLAERSIRSQGELRQALAEEGFPVTQATVSRDLVDLGATKSLDADGRPQYVLRTEVGIEPIADSTRLARAMHELAVSAAHSGPIVVVRTPPGAAQYLASVIDRSGWDAVLGTVAGDDTVLMVTAEPDVAPIVVDEVLAMAEGRAVGSSTDSIEEEQ